MLITTILPDPIVGFPFLLGGLQEGRRGHVTSSGQWDMVEVKCVTSWPKNLIASMRLPGKLPLGHLSIWGFFKNKATGTTGLIHGGELP